MDMAGIFDIKWRPVATPHEASSLLAVALADGRVSLMDLVKQQSGRAAEPDDPRSTTVEPITQDNCSSCGVGSEHSNLRELCATAVSTGNAMVLSLDWCKGSGDEPHRAALLASTSGGAVASLQVAMLRACAAPCPHLRTFST
jgi:hypothetical protein